MRLINRVVAVTLVVVLGGASTAFAGETLLSSGVRAAREQAIRSESRTAKAGAANAAGQSAQTSGAVSATGMRKRTKTMILVGSVAAFFAIAYGIDHSVKDVTPSSLGTRQD